MVDIYCIRQLNKVEPPKQDPTVYAMNNTIIQQQKKVCDKYGSTYVESPDSLKVGIALNVKSGLIPINGLRYQPESDTTGWYIWAGEEYSEDLDLWVSLHVELPFLALAPGWRFLIAGEYEDVWYDESLLEI